MASYIVLFTLPVLIPSSSSSQTAPYTLRANKLGAIVEGLNLTMDMNEDVAEQLKRDLYLNRILLFKNQGTLSGLQQIQFCSWFGQVEDDYNLHPKSQDKRAFLVSYHKGAFLVSYHKGAVLVSCH